MAGVANPALTFTLTDFIEAGQSDQLTYDTFSLFNELNGVSIATYNIVSDYLSELKQTCVQIPKENITVDQLARYKYNPDLLAYDLYGSTQLDFVILFINDMIDPKDFDIKTIKLIRASVMKQLLSDVYNTNEGYILQNRSDNNILN
jgi:hypothetical protein